MSGAQASGNSEWAMGRRWRRRAAATAAAASAELGCPGETMPTAASSLPRQSPPNLPTAASAPPTATSVQSVGPPETSVPFVGAARRHWARMAGRSLLSPLRWRVPRREKTRMTRTHRSGPPPLSRQISHKSHMSHKSHISHKSLKSHKSHQSLKSHMSHMPHMPHMSHMSHMSHKSHISHKSLKSHKSHKSHQSRIFHVFPYATPSHFSPCISDFICLPRPPPVPVLWTQLCLRASRRTFGDLSEGDDQFGFSEAMGFAEPAFAWDEFGQNGTHVFAGILAAAAAAGSPLGIAGILTLAAPPADAAATATTQPNRLAHI